MSHEIGGGPHSSRPETRSSLFGFIATRSLALLLLFGPATICRCQPSSQASTAKSPAPTGWDAVRALNPGASLDIKLVHGHQSCFFRAADDATLNCHAKADLALQRPDIRRITQRHRGRSTLAGLGIGLGAGIGIGAATTSSCSNWCIIGGKGFGAAAGGIVGGFIGTLVGVSTDFTHATVYKAP